MHRTALLATSGGLVMGVLHTWFSPPSVLGYPEELLSLLPLSLARLRPQEPSLSDTAPLLCPPGLGCSGPVDGSSESAAHERTAGS